MNAEETHQEAREALAAWFSEHGWPESPHPVADNLMRWLDKHGLVIEKDDPAKMGWT